MCSFAGADTQNREQGDDIDSLLSDGWYRQVPIWLYFSSHCIQWCIGRGDGCMKHGG